MIGASFSGLWAEYTGLLLPVATMAGTPVAMLLVETTTMKTTMVGTRQALGSIQLAVLSTADVTSFCRITIGNYILYGVAAKRPKNLICTCCDRVCFFSGSNPIAN